jgi:hypothetical protein
MGSKLMAALLVSGLAVLGAAVAVFAAVASAGDFVRKQVWGGEHA